MKVLNKEANLITTLQREESYPPLRKDFYSNESEVTPEVEAYQAEHQIEIHNISSGKQTTSPKTPPP